MNWFVRAVIIVLGTVVAGTETFSSPSGQSMPDKLLEEIADDRTFQERLEEIKNDPENKADLTRRLDTDVGYLKQKERSFKENLPLLQRSKVYRSRVLSE